MDPFSWTVLDKTCHFFVKIRKESITTAPLRPPSQKNGILLAMSRVSGVSQVTKHIDSSDEKSQNERFRRTTTSQRISPPDLLTQGQMTCLPQSFLFLWSVNFHLMS